MDLANINPFSCIVHAQKSTAIALPQKSTRSKKKQTDEAIMYIPNAETQRIMDNITDAPAFSLDNTIVYAKCLHVVDGDTIYLMFIMPRSDFYICKYKCRLMGYDSPEIKTHPVPATRAKNMLADIVLGKSFYVRLGKFDKYGRLLVTFNVTADPSARPAPINFEGGCETIADYMIRQDMGVAYFGGTKPQTK